MESQEQTAAWQNANDLSLTETAGKSMTNPEKHDSIEEVVTNHNDLLNDLNRMDEKSNGIAVNIDPLDGATNEIEDMFASPETKSSPAPPAPGAKAEALESILSPVVDETDEMHTTKTEVDFPAPSFDEQQGVTLKDGDLIKTATIKEVPVEFTAEEFSMPPSPHNNLSRPDILEAKSDAPNQYSDEKKDGDAAEAALVVPINEMFPTNSHDDSKPQPRKRSMHAEKANAAVPHLNKAPPKNNFKRDNSGKSISSKQQQQPAVTVATSSAAEGGTPTVADISPEEMTNQAELLAIKAKKLTDKDSKVSSVANNLNSNNYNAKAGRKSKPEAVPIADEKNSLINNHKSKEKIPPSTTGYSIAKGKEGIILPDIITSPMKGTSMAKKKELMQLRKRPAGEETKLPAIRGAQSFDDRLNRESAASGEGSLFSSETPGRDLLGSNDHHFDRLDQAHSSPMECSNNQLMEGSVQDEVSLSAKKKKRKPLYLRMIARARRLTHEEERKKHEQYLLLKQKRAKNNPTREEIREHMRLHDEAMKASLAQPKANHMAHVRALKKMNSFQVNDDDSQTSSATAGGGGAKSRAKLRQQLETYDKISERLDEQKKDRQRAYRKKLPTVNVAQDGNNDQQQRQQQDERSLPAVTPEEGSGFMSPRKPSQPKMNHHPRRHLQAHQLSAPTLDNNNNDASNSTMMDNESLNIEGQHAQQHEHEAHVPTHHPSPRKPPQSNNNSPRNDDQDVASSSFVSPCDDGKKRGKRSIGGDPLSPRVVTEEIQTQTDPDAFAGSSNSMMTDDVPQSMTKPAKETGSIAVVEINVLEQPLLARDDSILPDLKADSVPYYCAPDWMDMMNKTGGRSLSR